MYLGGVAAWLPPAVSVAEAVATRDYDADEQAGNEYVSITVANGEAPPEMAVRAARTALRRSGVAPGDVALLLHTSAWFQGVDFWGAASYVHREVLDGGRHAPALDVAQMSNGSLGAVELAASYLAATPSRRAALVTTADRFARPGFDRWRSDGRGIVYGDGAAAAVLTRAGGFARLRAVATVVDTRLEPIYRGDEPFGLVSGHAGRPVDIRERRRAFMEATTGRQDVVEWINAGLTEAVGQALDESETQLGDIARFVFPNIGLSALQRYLELLGVSLADTTWERGRRIGHVGGADQLIGLAHLVEGGHVGPGERVMLVGIGAGFSWSCAVVEMLDRPTWT